MWFNCPVGRRRGERVRLQAAVLRPVEGRRAQSRRTRMVEEQEALWGQRPFDPYGVAAGWCSLRYKAGTGGSRSLRRAGPLRLPWLGPLRAEAYKLGHVGRDGGEVTVTSQRRRRMSAQVLAEQRFRRRIGFEEENGREGVDPLTLSEDERAAETAARSARLEEAMARPLGAWMPVTVDVDGRQSAATLLRSGARSTAIIRLPTIDLVVDATDCDIEQLHLVCVKDLEPYGVFGDVRKRRPRD